MVKQKKQPDWLKGISCSNFKKALSDAIINNNAERVELILNKTGVIGENTQYKALKTALKEQAADALTVLLEKDFLKRSSYAYCYGYSSSEKHLENKKIVKGLFKLAAKTTPRIWKALQEENQNIPSGQLEQEEMEKILSKTTLSDEVKEYSNFTLVNKTTLSEKEDISQQTTLTKLFNFEARQQTTIFENTQTNATAINVKNMDEINTDPFIQRRYQIFKNLGGSASEPNKLPKKKFILKERSH